MTPLDAVLIGASIFALSGLFLLWRIKVEIHRIGLMIAPETFRRWKNTGLPWLSDQERNLLANMRNNAEAVRSHPDGSEQPPPTTTLLDDEHECRVEDAMRKRRG